MAKFVVGPIESMPPGTQHRVLVDGKNIAVYNVGGTYYALRDVCPHMGGPLSRGHVVGRIQASRPGCYEYEPGVQLVRCPWHGWEYELGTGRSWFDPRRNRVKAYDVSVEEGSDIVGPEGLLPGPYVVETIPISVEDEYVVVEMP
jgi:3-phenylpropionate/trans-cinnamate dioxygenase ferredoxin subunit